MATGDAGKALFFRAMHGSEVQRMGPPAPVRNTITAQKYSVPSARKIWSRTAGKARKDNEVIDAMNRTSLAALRRAKFAETERLNFSPSERTKARQHLADPEKPFRRHSVSQSDPFEILEPANTLATTAQIASPQASGNARGLAQNRPIDSTSDKSERTASPQASTQPNKVLLPLSFIIHSIDCDSTG